jgi:conjugal transfer pilin signal peptidase TrbI
MTIFGLTSSGLVKPVDRQTAISLALRMALIVLAFVCAGKWFASRYAIGLDRQVETSIPGRRLFLIDTQDITFDRKYEKVAFYARGLEPWFEDGTQMIKFVLGLPGSHVSIRADGVWIDGFKVLDGLGLAEPLGLSPSDVQREYTLAEGEYFVGGYHPKSYDSRYFGPIQQSQVRGTGYAF